MGFETSNFVLGGKKNSIELPTYLSTFLSTLLKNRLSCSIEMTLRVFLQILLCKPTSRDGGDVFNGMKIIKRQKNTENKNKHSINIFSARLISSLLYFSKKGKLLMIIIILFLYVYFLTVNSYRKRHHWITN